MGEKMRKQKLVSVCAVESTPINELKYFHTKAGSSSSTHLQTTVKAPINEHNLIMLEVYKEFNDHRRESGSSCIRLIFMLMCYGPNTRVDEMRYNFDNEYNEVIYVDFSGPIKSMRLAFELLQKFPRCKEVTFVLNDYNAQLPYEREEDLRGLCQNLKVESVKIIHDFSVVEKATMDVQTKKWRLDEILAGCQVCFPKLNKLEVCIHGTGSNYDKVSNFVGTHPILNGIYTVEIINQRVRCKQKLSTQKMVTSAPSGTKAVSSMELAKVAPLPIDLTIVKQEQGIDAAEQFPVPVPVRVPSISPCMQAPIDDHTDEIQSPITAGTVLRDRIGCKLQSMRPITTCNSNDGITPPPTPPALPVIPNAYPNSNSSEKEIHDMKALCWRNEKETSREPQHPLNQKVPSEMPSCSTSYLSSKEIKEKVQMQRLSSITSNSAYSTEVVDDEDVDDNRIRMARNPSPPVLNPTQNDENRSSTLGRPEPYSVDLPLAIDDTQGRRAAPSPPVISRERSSELRDSRLPYRSLEGSRSRSRSGSRSRRRDGRSRSRSGSRRRYDRSRSRSGSRSRRRYDRSRSRSGSRRRDGRSRSQSYGSRSRSPSPSSRKPYYRPRSRDYDYDHYSDGSRGNDQRWRRRRSYSRTPSPGPSYYVGGETSRRGGYDDGRDRGSYRRNTKRPYYTNSSRRPRGRGIRGFRARGRGRGRGYQGNRGGFKPQVYDNGGFFHDPRHQDDESYDDDEGDEEQGNM